MNLNETVIWTEIRGMWNFKNSGIVVEIGSDYIEVIDQYGEYKTLHKYFPTYTPQEDA